MNNQEQEDMNEEVIDIRDALIDIQVTLNDAVHNLYKEIERGDYIGILHGPSAKAYIADQISHVINNESFGESLQKLINEVSVAVIGEE